MEGDHVMKTYSNVSAKRESNFGVLDLYREMNRGEQGRERYSGQHQT